MTEKKDMYGMAKKEMRLSERILAALPGFRGYKEKELRRESDRLIRNHMYLHLSKAKSDLRLTFQRLTDRRAFEVLTDVDRLVAKFDRVAEKVNHASYGYAGFFDVVKIDEDNLDKMIDFDNQMMDDVDKIVSEVAAFKADVMNMKFDNAGQHVQKLTDEIEAFETVFGGREEVILGVS